MSSPDCGTKMEEVSSLLDIIDAGVRQESLSEKYHLPLLERLKVLSRDAHVAIPMFAKQGVAILASVGFDHGSSNMSREALRCLANALLLKPETRQILVDLGYAVLAIKVYETNRNDDEFLCSRILFLLTYGPVVDLVSLIRDYGLAEAVNKTILRHATSLHERSANGNSKASEEEEKMALSETLKLLFNLMHNQPNLEIYFTPSLMPILKTLCERTPHTTPTLQAPINHLVNALLNFSISGILDISNPEITTLVECLIRALDSATIDYHDISLNVAVQPLLTLLRHLYEKSPTEVQLSMQKLLLPPEKERDQPLGKSTSFFSRLLRLSTSVHMPNIGNSILNLLFELSGKDVNQFIHNVGYGHASGFLVSHNIHIPSSSHTGTNDISISEGGNMQPESTRQLPRGVNFVTGQYLDCEPMLADIPMTEDEKMREAERLFVLFERLKKTGIIDIDNPVHTAFQSGHCEEVD